MSHQILIVEDNQADRELLLEWLGSQEFHARATATLEQAYQAIQRQVPDLVLLDIQLGTDDGLALVAWLRRDPALIDLPVVAVTAHAMVTDYDRVMKAGCCGCISKPINFGLLSEYLARWLTHSFNPQLKERS
jgi:hypothetical protein